MATKHWLIAALAAGISLPTIQAQEPPKPGPEHAVFKKMIGNWDTTMKMAGAESKGAATYKMAIGGLWLESTFEGDVGGAKFTGRGFDSYDANKKKYVSVWMDSMSTTPMFMEGGFDKDKKSMTMIGEGPGMDGKATKFRSVTSMPDDNTIHFDMFMGDTKEPAFTIIYKRRK
jgi:hypothetical protein